MYWFSILFFAGCSSTTITQYGGMRDALRMGNTQARITFEEISSKPHAFAVGALTDLHGEITILDGKIYTASTSDGNLAFTRVGKSEFTSATLLSLAYVPRWISMELPTKEHFENAIELAASLLGTDTSEPFPFYIKGTASEFHLHVINGYCPVANPDLATEFQPWRLESTVAEEITIVGIYAKDQEGVMTHHGSDVHIHAILKIRGETATGHLDSVVLEPSATIYIPAN